MTDIQNDISELFDTLLEKGFTLNVILDEFRNGLVPPELSQYNSADVCRYAQLIGTQYLKANKEKDDAKLPETDLVQPA